MKHRIAIAAIAASMIAGGVRAEGLYANAFAGVLVFDSTVTIDGVKLIDQGGDAWPVGLRIGYGHRWPSGLYLGAEAEGFWGYGRSRALVNGELYNLSLRGGAGAFGRVGWQMTGGALGFARAGAQILNTNQGTLTLPAVGIGAELPISGRWYARVDLTYARSTERLYREFYQGTAGVGLRW